MSTQTLQPTADPEAPITAPRKRSWRWLRAAIPFAVVFVFWIATFAAHAYQEPDLSDPGTLSPTGTGGHGSSQLAARLASAGVTIDRVTSTDAALAAADGVDATIFVPEPDYLDGRLIRALDAEQGAHRVVLVRPGRAARAASDMPAGLYDSRWATRAEQPDCGAGYANQAGVAAVYHDAYTGIDLSTDCYGGAVVGWTRPGLEVLWIGATEPVRNDRIGEYGNAALATGLLSAHDRLIWLDVHRAEPQSVEQNSGEMPGAQPYERGDVDRTRTGDQLIDAFPANLWAVVVLLLAAGFVMAIVRSRRLGPPVAEPLPVVVPASEAVLGRGRLYRRIRANAASLQALRSAAISRIASAIDPLNPVQERSIATAGAARTAFVQAVAARSGLPEADVVTDLFGPAPRDEVELVVAVQSLDHLVSLVDGTVPPHQQPPSTMDSTASSEEPL